nr:tRNA-splicing endonuclease subunit [Polyrhizophydium stewartii]
MQALVSALSEPGDGPPALCGGLLWDAGDVARLRQDMRIVGGLAGALVQLPSQNALRGLPMHLMPEQVALLLDLGAAVLVNDGAAHAVPTEDDLHRQRSGHDAAMATYLANRAEYARQMRILKTSGAGVKGGSIQQDPAAGQMGQASVPVAPQLPVAVPSSSSRLSWFRPDLSAAAFSALAIESVPNHRRRVFRHLWERGWFITSGSKFGGDFLLYPKDPLLCHSTHVVLVLGPTSIEVTGQDVIRAGRLATFCRKQFMFCWCDPSGGEVRTMCVTWAR